MADNTAKNDITGDRIATKRSTTYADNYAHIDFSIKLEQPANYLLNDPIDGFNNSNGLETANLVSENNHKDSQNGNRNNREGGRSAK